LPDTPDLQRLLRRSPGRRLPVQRSFGDPVANRSIYNARCTFREGDQSRSLAVCFWPLGMLAASLGGTDAGRPVLRMLACRGEVARHDLGLGVVGAQHPHAVGEGLLVLRMARLRSPRPGRRRRGCSARPGKSNNRTASGDSELKNRWLPQLAIRISSPDFWREVPTASAR
jgi:hypothetical protein